MLRSFFRITFRNLFKNKVQSFINIAGLSAGMFVAILIALWIRDELTFDKYHLNYADIAQVMQSQTFNGTVRTEQAIPRPLEQEMKKNYGSDFKYIVMSSWTFGHILSFNDKKLMQTGTFMDKTAPDMLSLSMLKGTRSGLNDPSSVLLSESTAKALFSNTDPIGKMIKIDNQMDVTVTGVYEDLPYNTTFSTSRFIAPWELYTTTEDWIKESEHNWFNNSFQLFVQILPGADMAKLSAKIKNAKLNRLPKDDTRFKPELLLHPMSRWRLYPEFKDGVNTGGRIQYVWMFGITGVFVLLLACINFMNLSTACSGKRAKEVGILKSIGSGRRQLIVQFFGESLLISCFSLVFSLILVQISLPLFNEVADTRISILWSDPFFWAACLGFTFITGLIAGSYPALYLSSFKPVSVLKGTFRTGRLAAIPREILVVVQFAVSVILIIGTIIVFRQVQFTKNRPVGYTPAGLVMVTAYTSELHHHFELFRRDLISSGTALDAAESSSPVTRINSNSSGLDWKGKDPEMTDDFGTIGVSYDFGKTVGWQFKDGRDFSRDFPADSSGIVINEAAADYMGLKDPVGETVKWGTEYKILGVIKNMVMQSPYKPSKQSIFYLVRDPGDNFTIRINPAIGMQTALRNIEDTFKKYSPGSPFEYKFADSEYAAKFNTEERVGKLAAAFAALAIFISCLGLFGMASFMAEQRTKEIGVRKVLGASVMQLWQLLSRNFVLMALISFFIAVPVSYLLMNQWLQNYQYRSDISLWIFLATGAGLLLITLLTTGVHIVKAAMSNPVESLRAE